MSEVVTDSVVLRQVEGLLYDEADCLDKADLDAWIDLYTEDATYWMPVTPDQTDPLNHVSLFYDDRALMEVRRRNLKHPRAPSKDYAVRCSHLIANLRVAEQADATLIATSNFHCLVYYNEKQTLYGGRYRHELVAVGSDLKIRHKRVDLINCDAALGTIIIYL